MKRLIFILSIVCTIFLSCGVTALAFDTGDVINGVKIDLSNFSYEYVDFINDCNYYVCFEGSNEIWFSKVPFVALNSKTLTFGYPDNKVLRYSSSSYCCFFTGSSINFSGKSIISSSHTIYDTSGNVVFPQAPAVTQTPAPEQPQLQVPQGVQAVQIIPAAITANLKILLPLGLVALAILLGVRLVPRLIAFFL